jgi:pimeloyl-[acyl-carrier protein] methyl ester esterase
MSGLNIATTGQGRDLVLVHGWGMNGSVWASLVAVLAPDFRVTVIELPGHGSSDYDASLNSLDEWSNSLLNAAPERAVWVGWSLGGQLAMNAALLAPERVSALILVASTPRFVLDEDWPHALSPGTFTQFAERLRTDPAATLSRFLALQVLGAEHERETLKQLKLAMQHRREPKAEALIDSLRLLLETDLRSSMVDLQPPTLWMLGNRDALVPGGLANELPKLLPQAEIHLLNKAAHAPFLSHTQDCGKLLLEFLREN